MGEIARPDLAVTAEEGAHDIFRSLHGGLLAMAPEVEVWPGHLGGSMCGGPAMSHEGELHHRLRAGPQPLARRAGRGDASSRRSLAAIGPQPPNFREIVGINRGPLVTMDATTGR